MPHTYFQNQCEKLRAENKALRAERDQLRDQLIRALERPLPNEPRYRGTTTGDAILGLASLAFWVFIGGPILLVLGLVFLG